MTFWCNSFIEMWLCDEINVCQGHSQSQWVLRDRKGKQNTAVGVGGITVRIQLLCVCWRRRESTLSVLRIGADVMRASRVHRRGRQTTRMAGAG